MTDLAKKNLAQEITFAKLGTPGQDDESSRALEVTWRTTALLLPIVIAVPLVLEPLYQSRRTYADNPSLLFDFASFLLCGAVIAGVTVAAIKTQWRAVLLAPSLAFAAVVLTAVQWMATHTKFSEDFITYRKAGTALLTGMSPFPEYTYPPVFAQTLGYAAYWLSDVAPAGFGSGDPAWHTVFYLYSIIQVVLTAILFVLLYRIARSLGASDIYAAILVAAVMLINIPLQETFSSHQANLYVLVFSLSALAIADRSAPLAGLATALGSVIKVYPAALVPLWWISGRKKVAMWSVVCAALLVLAYPPLDNWIGFVRFWLTESALEYPRSSDATLFNLIANGARLVGIATPSQPPLWTRIAFNLLAAAILAWGARRIWRRRQMSLQSDSRAEYFAMAISTAEILALTLLISPRVWPHQFVYAMPLMIIASTIVQKKRLIFIVLAGGLIFAFTYSEIFFAPFVRQLGVALLLIVSGSDLTSVKSNHAQSF